MLSDKGAFEAHNIDRKPEKMKRNIAIVILLAGLAPGATITLLSGVSAGESNNITGTNFVIPGLEPAWVADRQDGASWISFDNTGWQSIGGVGSAVITLPNATPGDPNAIFYQTFTDSAGTLLTGSISVWADDTAAVYLDGALLLAPNYSQASTNCAPDDAVTCNNSGMTANFTTTPGTHILSFDVYQTGSWTYGVMYDGSVTDNGSSATPEPESYILLGGGLIALGIFRHNRKPIY
jgi:hypothetical protein